MARRTKSQGRKKTARRKRAKAEPETRTGKKSDRGAKKAEVIHAVGEAAEGREVKENVVKAEVAAVGGDVDGEALLDSAGATSGL
mmetsp:Transcript_4096/g.7479  ORF Transcript_4096/g.7479 Transcript_4096/m.7479 type:complete len:85 (-) Transcript_4096:232-486(-)